MSKRLGHGCKYSKRDITMLHTFFTEADKDGDGFVKIAEFNEYIKDCEVLGADHSRGLGAFRALDINKDNKLTFDEYLKSLYPLANDKELKVMLSWVARAPPPPEAPSYEPDAATLDDLKRMFIIYDKDKSGSISVKELLAVADACGYSKGEFESLFAASDTDANGSLSLEEFVALMQSCYL